MIILPDRSISHTKLLMPMLRKQWMPPSEAQPKTVFGHETTTFYRVSFKHKNKIIWRGNFLDRDDFDNFLFGIAIGSIKYDKYLWNLPTPELNPAILEYEDTIVLYATQTIYTGTTTTTYSKPVDWNGGSNKIECLGGGGQGGGCLSTSGNGGGGGGGGSYARTVNTTALTYLTQFRVQAGAAGSGAGAGQGGNNGSSSSFKSDSTGGEDLCLASGGFGGIPGDNIATGDSGQGGYTIFNVYSGTGSVSYQGGDGGLGSWTTASVKGAGGGGGAAGRDGNGGNEPGDGYGGSAGYGVDNNDVGSQLLGGALNTNGNSGGEYGGGIGHGSGCGRKTTGSGSLTTGSYGAGGGGARSLGTSLSGGAGTQGLVIVTYTPLLIQTVNIPNMGL